MNIDRTYMNQEAARGRSAAEESPAPRKQVPAVHYARYGNLDEIVASVVQNYITPVPSKQMLRIWFDRAGVKRFKANLTAIRGGGSVYYALTDVERFLRHHTLPGGMRALHGKTTL
jgi:hypothetical protein